jgi:hypothetical protein
MMLVLSTALGYLLARIRLDTGSIWPAVTLHGAWNLIIQTGFDPLVSGADRAVWVGEVGIFTTIIVLTTAVIVAYRKPAANAKTPQAGQMSGGHEPVSRSAGRSSRSRRVTTST